MMDAPPAEPAPVHHPVRSATAVAPVQPNEDGALVIDLTTLVPDARPQECIESDPNPLDSGILVCRALDTDQRIDPTYGPADEPEFGSAIPRARVKITDNAEAEANAINKGVGGINANGGEVRVKIDF